MSSRIFCFDLETTGIGRNAVPVQIAGVILDPNHPGLPQVGEFHEFLQVSSLALPFIEDYAMNMHAEKGRTLEWFQANGKPPHVVYSLLNDWLLGFGKRLIPAGHNASGFDMRILNAELEIHMGKNFKLPLDYHTLDTMIDVVWSKTVTGTPARVNLDATCAHYGIPFNKEAAHDALYDVKATAEVLRKQWFARGGK